MRQTLFLLLLMFFGFTLKAGNVLHVGTGQKYQKFPDAVKDVKPGDTILLHPGKYDGNGRINHYYNLIGEEGKPITIMAKEAGTASFYGKYGSWYLSKVCYLNFINLTFDNMEGNFVNIDDGGVLSHHIRFVNCTFKDLNIAVSENADFLKLSGVDHVEVLNCTFINGLGGSGIDMVGCHHGLIKGCYFEETGMNAVQVKGGSQYVRIEGNFMKHCGDRSVNLGGQTGPDYFRPKDAKFEAADLEVYSNIMIGTYSPVAFVGCIRTVVANNTLIATETGKVKTYFIVRILQERVNPNRFIPCGNNSFVNNIIYRGNKVSNDCNVGEYTDPGSFTFANNLWFNYDNPNWNGPTRIPVIEENRIIGKDPLFNDAANDDFTIPANSPAAGKGLNVEAPDLDYAGIAFAPKRSIGAFEASQEVVKLKFDPDTLWRCGSNTPVTLSGGLGSHYKWTLPDGNIRQGATIQILQATLSGRYILQVTHKGKIMTDTCWVMDMKFDASITKNPANATTKTGIAQTFGVNIKNKLPDLTYEWTFEGGTPATSNEPSASVVWNTGGKKRITLKLSATGKNGEGEVTCSTLLTIDENVEVLPVNKGKVLHVGTGKPYPTLEAAIKDVTPGDTILIFEGKYQKEGLLYIRNLSGEEGKDIIIQGVPDENVILYGSGTKITNVSYIKFRNLIFEEYPVNLDDGNVYDKPSHHVVFESCTFKGQKGSLSLAGVDHFEVMNCTFIQNSIGLAGCHYGLIKNCRLEKTGYSALGVAGGSHHIRIEANLFKDCTDRGIVLGGQSNIKFLRPQDATYEAADIQVYANVITGANYPIWFNTCVRGDVVNNTIINPGKQVINISQRPTDADKFMRCGNNSFVNNIIYQKEGVTDCSIGNNTDRESFVFSNNLWYNYDNQKWNGPKNIPVLEHNVIIGKNPLFNNINKDDYSIPSHSPAVGKGAKVNAPGYDFTGKPFTKNRSIGAFEAGIVLDEFQFDPDTIWRCGSSNNPVTLKGGVATHYKWTLPDGSIKEGAGLKDLQAVLPGKYILEMTQGASVVTASCWLMNMVFDASIARSPANSVPQTGTSQTFSVIVKNNLPNLTYEWTFENGSPEKSNNPVVSTIWNTPGMKKVTLKLSAKGKNGTDWILCDTILSMNIEVASTPVQNQYKVFIPSNQYLTSDPIAGEYLITKGHDFKMELAPKNGYSLKNLVIKTGSKWQDEEGGMLVLHNNDGSVTVTFRKVEESLNITFSDIMSVSNEWIGKPFAVWANDSQLYVKTLNKGTLRIYNLNGVIVDQRDLLEGERVITLASGIYVVTFNNEYQQKVVIK